MTPADADCVISIGCPDQVPPKNLSSWAATDRLRLQFLDLDDDALVKLDIDEAAAAAQAMIFTTGMAADIKQFAQALAHRPTPLRLAIHCEVGASRSAAVAQVLATWQGLELNRGTALANTRVRRLLQAAMPRQTPDPLQVGYAA